MFDLCCLGGQCGGQISVGLEVVFFPPLFHPFIVFILVGLHFVVATLNLLVHFVQVVFDFVFQRLQLLIKNSHLAGYVI